MRAILITALVLAASVSSQAQSPGLKPGDRIQVDVPQRVTGTLLYADSAQLRLRLPRTESPLVLPWSSVTRLRISEPRTRAGGAWNRTKWGLAIGAGIGALVLLSPPPEPGEEDLSNAELAAAAVIEGALLGALTGIAWPGRHWRDRDIVRTRALLPVTTVALEPSRADRPHEENLSRPGSTPALEWTFATAVPRTTFGQFPPLHLAMALNGAFTPTVGAALTGEATAEIFRTAVLGGVRVFSRTSPLYSRRRVLTYFGQVLAGQMRAERSGVVAGTGGLTVQPGVGLDYGSGFVSGRLQLDYSIVRDGFVFDDRVTTGPVEELSGLRVLFGVTLRSR